MSLPKQLIDSFAEMKASPLVQGNVTKETIQSFVDALNRAIPSPLNVSMYAVYRFNRSKYQLNKSRFVSEIKDFSPFDAMILWTDFNDILTFFNLTGKIFLGWDKNKNRYRAFILSAQPPVDNILRKGEKLQPQLSSNTVTTLASMEDDNNRVFDYMQQRIAASQKQQ